uniref:SLC2A4 regulator isoform X2 n=1 Tax=Jaculus jaculus TaxID=51337 RepID=UPI001E1AF4EE|nr:SLC2A4 regulator isoform X2 [Jaculus jaculus]
MEAECPPAPGAVAGCEHPLPRASDRNSASVTARDPCGLRTVAPGLSAESQGRQAAPVTMPAPPQGPFVGGGLVSLKLAPPRAVDLGAPGTESGAAARLPTPSAHIPVPIQRVSPGKARLDEVVAAAALTSLSTSPLCVGATEPGLDPWKETVQPTGSYSSSSNSGDWGWDLASDQSSPSTPSPPLPPEATHFLFGEPTLRKRKSSIQVMFQCLWKSCGKVLSTASGMQRHIRLVHLGRQTEPDQSDGEEDFYYTELDIDMDTLTDGLSSLTPVSPTTSIPLTFPRLDPPELLQPLTFPPPLMHSSVAAPQACHTDHAYQAGVATDRDCRHVSEHSKKEQSRGYDSPQDCLSPICLEPQPTEAQTYTSALPTKLGANLRCVQVDVQGTCQVGKVQADNSVPPACPPRKPRSDAKKCRKVYGMDHRDLWCTACRWKKACQRFLD